MPHDSVTDRAQAWQIPLPDSPWFGYCVIPVTSCLRPPDEESGVTPDMCVPIQPNKGHPLGREGLETQPTFPFDNCYHWSDACCQMDVRVRASTELFDDDTSIKLPPSQRIKLSRLIRDDYARMKPLQEPCMDKSHAGQESRSPEAQDTPTKTFEAEQRTDERTEAVRSLCYRIRRAKELIGRTFAETQTVALRQRADHSSESPRTASLCESCVSSGEYGASPSVIEEVRRQLRTGEIHEEIDRQVELDPLVDLWYDIPGHLKKDQIPSPIDLFVEREILIR